MFSQDRNQLRKMFFSVWQKHQQQQVLEPLEQVIAEVIAQHPEYHAMLQDEEAHLDRDYSPEMGETNPFLHMSMHIAIVEQLSTQRPTGILDLYRQLCQQAGNAHNAEHLMMECLGEMIWQAQRNNAMPDENTYLECLHKRLGQA